MMPFMVIPHFSHTFLKKAGFPTLFYAVGVGTFPLGKDIMIPVRVSREGKIFLFRMYMGAPSFYKNYVPIEKNSVCTPAKHRVHPNLYRMILS